MSEQGFAIMCQRSGRGRGCKVVVADIGLLVPDEGDKQCCLCPAPGVITGPRGSRYCALHGQCGRCGTSVSEMVQDKQGVYLCPCYWDWDAATKQRKVKQSALMSGHYMYGGKV